MTSEICIMCKQNVDDVYLFGEKITFEDVTAHYFCLLLSGYLAQKGDDNQGIFGFMPDDIKKEAKRAKTWRCKFCKKAGANISCCNTKCRKAFHLACAAEHNCRFEFVNSFQSFCDAHHDIKKPNHVHKPTDLCTICYDEMGKYNLIQSIPLPCCNKNAWCHKLCLQKYAQTSGYFLKCPLCKDSDNFRNFIAERGVFIPDRDAKWEIDDCGTNTFYDFEQHTERPSECEAKICKCHKGRNYQVDIENDKNSLVYCHYCGSHAVHLGCFKGEEFLCEECTTIVNRTRENAANTSSARSDREKNSRRSAANHSRPITQTPSIAGENQSGVMGIHTEERFGGYLQSHAHLVYKFKLREFSINIKRITQKRNESSEYNESSEIQMKDERVIKPVMLRNKRSIRAKRSRQNLPQNQFFDSDDTDDVGTVKVDINNNCIDAELSNGSFRLKQQHKAYITKCDSKDRKMGQIDQNNEYLCGRCGLPGDKAIHKTDNICDDCELEPSPKKRKKKSGYVDDLDSHLKDMNNNNIPMYTNTNCSPKTLNHFGQFVPEKFKIFLNEERNSF